MLKIYGDCIYYALEYTRTQRYFSFIRFSLPETNIAVKVHLCRGRSLVFFVVDRKDKMGKSKTDIWAEFIDGEASGDDLRDTNEKRVKKTVKDGSEWEGKFDRRSSPRDEAADPDAQDKPSG